MTLKSIFYLGIILLSVACGTKKEVSYNSTEDLPTEFFQRWKMDYGTLNGQKVSGYPPSPEQDYVFNADGTYILYSPMSTDLIGVWEYNSSDKCVYTKREDGEINAIIKDITPVSFILIPPKESVEGTPLTSLTFYYVPKPE